MRRVKAMLVSAARYVARAWWFVTGRCSECGGKLAARGFENGELVEACSVCSYWQATSIAGRVTAHRNGEPPPRPRPGSDFAAAIWPWRRGDLVMCPALGYSVSPIGCIEKPYGLACHGCVPETVR